MVGSNDSFADHGIDHLSASQINTFIANPCRWILWVSGYTDKAGNANMWRGTATDKAVCAMLGDGLSKEDALELGIKSYADELRWAKKISDSGIDLKIHQTNSERLPKYINAALDFYSDKGSPVATQEKIEIQDESISVPIIGYIDLRYADAVRDIKTAARKPANDKLTEAVNRQMAVYWRATELVPVADYIIVTAKTVTTQTYPVLDIDVHWDMVIRAARAMQRVLSISVDIEEIASHYIPDFSDWTWSEAEINEAKKLWRLK